MPLHTWRRHHGPDVVAQVAPEEGLGLWAISTWLASNPSVVVNSPRKIASLTSAQGLADHLARETFDHVCDLERCGDWMFWPQ
jgi:hypothetical protein